MLDTARHFLPVELLERMLDAMEWNKLNVLRLHLYCTSTAPPPHLRRISPCAPALT